MNRRVLRLCCLMCVIFTPLASAFSQDAQRIDTLHCTLSSEPAGAEVWLGDSLFGLTPLQLEKSQCTKVRVFYPAKNAYRKTTGAFAGKVLNAQQGINIVHLPIWKRIETIPYGTEVFIGDSLLGTTPLDFLLQGDSVVAGLRKKGFHPSEVLILRDEAYSINKDMVLEAFSDNNCSVKPYFGSSLFPSARLYVPAGLGLASAIGAVILKQDADRYYAQYLATYDKDKLQQARKYDIYSGICLVAMQLAVGYFLYLLFDGL